MGRNKTRESRSYIGTAFQNTIFFEIERLTGESHLRRAQLVRALIIRGLAAYYRDGKILHELGRNLVEIKNLISLDDYSGADRWFVNQQPMAGNPVQA